MKTHIPEEDQKEEIQEGNDEQVPVARPRICLATVEDERHDQNSGNETDIQPVQNRPIVRWLSKSLTQNRFHGKATSTNSFFSASNSFGMQKHVFTPKTTVHIGYIGMMRDDVLTALMGVKGCIQIAVADPKHHPLTLLAILVAAWIFASTVIMTLVYISYIHSSVGDAQMRFVIRKAQTVGVEVASVFQAALIVYDAFDYAIQRKLFFEPLDYDVIASIVQPVFAKYSSVRAVDLAFTSRSDSISVWRRLLQSKVHWSEPIFVLQSNASDCWDRLGEKGCLRSVPARSQPWYTIAAAIPAGQESESIGMARYKEVKRGRLGSAFRWGNAPRAVPFDGSMLPGKMVNEKADLVPTIRWDVGYAMTFRSVFPGTGASLSLVGRVLIEVSGLRNVRLVDPDWLGSEGGIVVCDRAGFAIGVHSPSMIMQIGQSTGRGRFRKVWELDFAWAKQLQKEWNPTAGAKSFSIDDFQVAMVPLTGRGLDQFSVIVAADRQAFRHKDMDSRCVQMLAVAYIPCPVGLLIACLCWTYTQNAPRPISAETTSSSSDAASSQPHSR